MTTVILTEVHRSGTYGKCSDFIRAIASQQVALLAGITNADRYLFANRFSYTPDDEFIQQYKDDTLQTATARTNYSIFDIGAGNQIQMYYDETGAGPTYWATRSGTTLDLLNLPKTQTVGSFTKTTGSFNQLNCRYIILPTSDIPGFARWITRFLADPKKMIRPRNAHIARKRDEISPFYLNDLGQNVTPFYIPRRATT